jgi:hypothetical protein
VIQQIIGRLQTNRRTMNWLSILTLVMEPNHSCLRRGHILQLHSSNTKAISTLCPFWAPSLMVYQSAQMVNPEAIIWSQISILTERLRPLWCPPHLSLSDCGMWPFCVTVDLQTNQAIQHSSTQPSFYFCWPWTRTLAISRGRTAPVKPSDLDSSFGLASLTLVPINVLWLWTPALSGCSRISG